MALPFLFQYYKCLLSIKRRESFLKYQCPLDMLSQILYDKTQDVGKECLIPT
jgi:hypothetical protein